MSYEPSRHHAALHRAARVADEISAMFWGISSTRQFGVRGSVRLNEPSFTEWLLVFLEGNQVLTQYQFTGSQESRIGADWEWWIGADGLGWRCARIQAKRAYVNSFGVPPTYDRLNHTVGDPPQAQINLLIDGAANGINPSTGRAEAELVGVIQPYYVFYNGWPDSSSISELDTLAGNFWQITEHARRRNDHPVWGEWAVQSMAHFTTCRICRQSEHVQWLAHCATCQSCRGSVEPPATPQSWQSERCLTPVASLTHRELVYWGASTLDAFTTKTVLDTNPSPHNITPYFGQSLPFSTILFDQWDVLSTVSKSEPRPIAQSLPGYAQAVRYLERPDDGPDALGMLSQYDDLAVRRVAVTDFARASRTDDRSV